MSDDMSDIGYLYGRLYSYEKVIAMIDDRLNDLTGETLADGTFTDRNWTLIRELRNFKNDVRHIAEQTKIDGIELMEVKENE